MPFGHLCLGAYTICGGCAEYDVTKEKQRLQNLMTYGSDLEPTPTSRVTPRTQAVEEKEEERDRFDEGIQLSIDQITVQVPGFRTSIHLYTPNVPIQSCIQL